MQSLDAKTIQHLMRKHHKTIRGIAVRPAQLVAQFVEEEVLFGGELARLCLEALQEGNEFQHGRHSRSGHVVDATATRRLLGRDGQPEFLLEGAGEGAAHGMDLPTG